MEEVIYQWKQVLPNIFSVKICGVCYTFHHIPAYEVAWVEMAAENRSKQMEVFSGVNFRCPEAGSTKQALEDASRIVVQHLRLQMELWEEAQDLKFYFDPADSVGDRQVSYAYARDSETLIRKVVCNGTTKFHTHKPDKYRIFLDAIVGSGRSVEDHLWVHVWVPLENIWK